MSSEIVILDLFSALQKDQDHFLFFFLHITEQPCFCLAGRGRYTPLLGDTKLRPPTFEFPAISFPGTFSGTFFPEMRVLSGKRLEEAAAATATTSTASLPKSLPKSEGSFEEVSSSPLLTLHELWRRVWGH